MMRFLKHGLLLSLFAALLASCGGGSDSVISLPGLSNYTVTLTAATNVTSAASPLAVEATVEDANGDPAQGVTVVFSTDVGNFGGVASTAAVTDTNGVASATLSAGSGGVKAGTVTARFIDASDNVALDTLAVTTLGDDTSGGGGGTPTGEPSITLAIRDGGGAVITASNPITTLNPGRLIATVTQGGVGVAGVVVNFTGPSVVTLAAPTALTNASGVAEVSVTAASTGAGTATADAVVDSTPISSSATLATSISSTPAVTLALGTGTGGAFTNGALTSSATGAIDSGSTITISGDVVDAATHAAYTAEPVVVTFTSVCVAQGKAVIDAQDTTAGGHFEVTYRPTNCPGQDTITATLTTATQNLTATVDVDIAAADVGQIAFISAVPSVIALQGTGGTGRLTRSSVTFQVLGTDGNPVGGRRVCFNLSTTVGGLTLGNSSAISNSSGDVIATVNAGSVPTSVRVNATVDDADPLDDCTDLPVPAISAVSDALVVSTGLPDQNSFSLSLETLNPLAYDFDGVAVRVTARAADHFNNPVPDGTAISFWSELGAIQPSCTTVDGACSVTWRSQAPKDNADPTPLTSNGLNDRRGRSTIVAYAVGEESFTDSNGNGRYDVGEPTIGLSEVIKDSNENGTRDEPGELLNGFEDEEFVDFDQDGLFDPANTRYDGVLCAVVDPATCSGDATVNVRDDIVLVLSAVDSLVYFLDPAADLSGINYDVGTTWTTITGIANPAANPMAFTYAVDETVSDVTVSGGGTAVRVLVTDRNGNAPAVGTKIEGALYTNSGTPKLVGTTSFTVPQQTNLFTASFQLPSMGGESGRLGVKVTSPGQSPVEYFLQVYP